MGRKFWQKKKPAAVPDKPAAPLRDFDAAAMNRITSSLANESSHIMRILRDQGKVLRARSRQLAANNCYATKFVSMAVSNIAGPHPFKLQAKVRSSRGKLDAFANSRIETEWAEWGRPGQCDVTGRLSWNEIQQLIVRTLVVDGECLIRVLEGGDFGPWGIQLQVLESDRLDENKNEELKNGGQIVAGVELDVNGRTVAYHFLRSTPKIWSHGYSREYIRVPADQIIHLYLPQRAEQVRGIPWMHSAIIKLHQLGAFEEAAIIASRVGASKMGFYQQKGGDGFIPPGSTLGSDGNYHQSAEPGEFGIVPQGYEFKDWNPNYPDAQVEPFMKSCLRGLASGLNVTYHSLANNLEAVNFSSARAGMLEERDNWMLLQQWLVDHLHIPLYRRWLRMALLTSRLSLQGPEPKFWDVTWSPKRWTWVDPLKDVQANINAIQWGLKSRTQVVNETGADLEDIMTQLKSENDMAEDAGVNINPEQIDEPDQASATPKEEEDGTDD
jgi:lambda family phage portal protein